jgi:hemoglobin-like flavoprotein
MTRHSVKDSLMLTLTQKTLVQESFAKIAPIADDAAALFYRRLFDIDPSLRRMFHGDMAEQRRKLMLMLTVAVKGLDRLDELVPAVQNLGRRHGTYGVTDAQYDTVAAALLWTLEKGLGPMFTAETREAWVTVYSLLATTMREAAREAAVAA